MSKYTLTAWKVGLAFSLVTLAFSFLYAMFPPLKYLSLPLGFRLPSLYPLLFIGIWSLGWVALGYLRRSSDGNPFWCGIAFLLLLFSGGFMAMGALAETGV